MLNKIISLVMMIMFIPIFFIIGLIIVIDDGFPIFFLQKRIGKNKKLFHIIKFRTMNNNTKDIATHLVKNYDNKILAYQQSLQDIEPLIYIEQEIFLYLLLQ